MLEPVQASRSTSYQSVYKVNESLNSWYFNDRLFMLKAVSFPPAQLQPLHPQLINRRASCQLS